jgi:hypothetical protein
VIGIVFSGFLDSCHYNSSTLEKCHYNSAILKLAITILHTSEPCHFIRLLRAWARCQAVYVYVYFVNTTAASLPPLNDVRAPLVRFFFNLRPGGQRRAPALGARPRAAAGSQRRAAAQASRRGRRRWHRRWLLTDPPCSRRHGPAPELPRPHAPARKEGSRAVPCSPPGCHSRRRTCRPSFMPPLAGR